MVSGKRILLMVSAERREFDGLLRRLASPVNPHWPVEFCRRGELNGAEVVLLSNGAGPALASEGVRIAASQQQFDAVVSTGLCGALDPGLAVGDVFVATRVDAVEQSKRYPVVKPATERRYAEGLLRSADRVVVSAAEKARLRETGAAVVEMEAAGVAGEAQRAGVPFYCIRAVSDTADQGFLLDLNCYRDGEGRFRKAAIVAASCLNPLAAWPELIRLQRRSKLASENLGEFLADCRF